MYIASRRCVYIEVRLERSNNSSHYVVALLVDIWLFVCLPTPFESRKTNVLGLAPFWYSLVPVLLQNLLFPIAAARGRPAFQSNHHKAISFPRMRGHLLLRIRDFVLQDAEEHHEQYFPNMRSLNGCELCTSTSVCVVVPFIVLYPTSLSFAVRACCCMSRLDSCSISG